jgi:hypothetical protein
LDTRTTLDQPDGLTFQVRELQYDLELGWRGLPGRPRGPRLSALLGQRGKQAVDADGQPWVRYAAARLESPDYRAYRTTPASGAGGRGFLRRLEWELLLGAVFDEREVRADAVLQGEASLWLAPVRGRSMALAFDVAVDGLFEGSSLHSDVSAGPRLSFAVVGGRRASFYLYHRSGGNPLGVEEPLWLLGFAYTEGREAPPSGLGGPEIDGRLVAGGGEGRIAGQLRLRFLSPEFAGATRGSIVIDANLLTAEETGDLFYYWTAGLERERSFGIYGAYLHHRSNHQLAEPNDQVTSLNVLELGYETLHWQRSARCAPRRGWGAIDGRVRAGYLLESSFGERERWHVRGGLRWSLPVRGRAPLPYLLVEAASGEVERRLYAAGLSLRGGLELQLEYRSDEQYYAEDSRALLGSVRYWF